MKIKIKKFKMIEIPKNKFGEFNFSDSVNIISGDNGFGKSTFIKSLMHTLGFEIIEWNDLFNKDNFIFIITCEIDNKYYEIIRFRNIWTINDQYYDLKKYREFLKQTLKIDSKLTLSSNNAMYIPYPSDLFLFNYVDQDSSFNNLFKGNHKKIGMYKNKEVYKLFEEYIGVSNQKVEAFKIEKNNLSAEQKKIKNEQNTIKIMLNNYNKENGGIISLKASDYKEQVKCLEEKATTFFKERNKLEKAKYTILNHLKQLDFERIQLEEIYDELEKNTAEIHCKFCNSLVNKNFKEMYQRELNKNSLIIQYADVKAEIIKNNQRLEINERKIIDCEEQLYEIQNLFSETKNNLELSEIIENNIKFGIKKELSEAYDNKEASVKAIKGDMNILTSKIKKEKQNLQEQKEKIIKYYNNKVGETNKIFSKIDISSLDNKFMEFNNKKTGAERNIVSVIIYYIYFSVLTKFSKIKFPIIWDTFLKEVLDDDNFNSLESLVNNNILKLQTQIICSNVSNSEKELKIENTSSYNLITINNNICNLEVKEEEELLISKMYNVMQNN